MDCATLVNQWGPGQSGFLTRSVRQNILPAEPLAQLSHDGIPRFEGSIRPVRHSMDRVPAIPRLDLQLRAVDIQDSRVHTRDVPIFIESQNGSHRVNNSVFLIDKPGGKRAIRQDFVRFLVVYGSGGRGFRAPTFVTPGYFFKRERYRFRKAEQQNSGRCDNNQFWLHSDTLAHSLTTPNCHKICALITSAAPPLKFFRGSSFETASERPRAAGWLQKCCRPF